MVIDYDGCAVTSERVASGEPVATSERKLSARTVLAVIIGGLAVLFAALNSQSVTTHWLIATTDTPLVIVIVGCALLGFAAGWLVARRSARHKAG
jgi:uncharacterized integral membrane protein